jgi:hypothetical protein
MEMRKPNSRRLTLIIALMFIIGAVFFTGITAYAAETETETTAETTAETTTETIPEPVSTSMSAFTAITPLIVKEVWLTGDTLHISVSDGGEGQVLELNLRSYAMPGDEFVTIQATDGNGRESNAITFKNPYYVQSAESVEIISGNNESATPDTSKPFTPDGTGTVVDNAHDGDGKEFFTVSTDEGNVFYLIVDRQRNTDNVYLLNAVTENDLLALSKPGDGSTISAVPTPAPPVTPTPIETPAPTPTPEPAPTPISNNNTGMMAFIGLGALIIGGAAYYFKIVRPKKSGAATEYESDDFEDEEMDVVDDDEDGEDV